MIRTLVTAPSLASASGRRRCPAANVLPARTSSRGVAAGAAARSGRSDAGTHDRSAHRWSVAWHVDDYRRRPVKAIAVERELKLDVDPASPCPTSAGGRSHRARSPPPTSTRRTAGCCARGSRFAAGSRTAKGVWQLKLPSDDRPLRAGGARRPERAPRGLPRPARRAPARRRARRRSRSCGPGGRASPSGPRTGPRRGRRGHGRRCSTAAASSSRSPRSRPRSSRATALDARRDRQGAPQGGRRARATGSPKLARVSAPSRREPPRPRTATRLARLRRLLVEQYETMLANDPGVRLGEDIEALHQLRVATRRSRALLRAARGLVAAEWAEPLRARARLARRAARAGSRPRRPARAPRRRGGRARGGGRPRLPPSARPARGRARRRPGGAARSDGRARATSALLDTLEGRARHRPASYPTPLAEIAGRAVRAPAQGASKALPKTPTDDELHRVRIDTKRARYAAELAAPELGKAGARACSSAAKELQDVIGEHQDACVAEERLRALAAARRRQDRPRRRPADRAPAAAQARGAARLPGRVARAWRRPARAAF